MEIKTLITQQRKALEAMLTCTTVADAARQSGTALRTLERWLTDDGFNAALSKAQTQLISATVRRLAHTSGAAIDVLKGIMATSENDAVRARVALGVLAALPALKALGDFEERLAALEQVTHAD